MGTTVVALEAEAQCGHLSRTDVGKRDSGRQVCDDCKQIFQFGIPVTVVPPIAVVPPVTEAAPTNKKPARGNKSTALATATKTDDDKLSSSSAEASLDLAEENKQAAGIAKMSSTELHTEIIQTYQLTGENFITYRLLVLDARRRMHDGEAVGECTTWKDYENRYLKKDGESLPTCMRRVARLLEGINPDTKHKNKRHKKSNRKILEESLDQNERLVTIAKADGYKKGFSDGEVAGEKKMKFLAAKMVADKKKSNKKTEAVTATEVSPTEAVDTITDIFYVIRRKTDGKFWTGHIWSDNITQAYPNYDSSFADEHDLFHRLEKAAHAHSKEYRTPIKDLCAVRVTATYALKEEEVKAPPTPTEPTPGPPTPMASIYENEQREEFKPAKARTKLKKPVYKEGIDFDPAFLTTTQADELFELMKSQPFADNRASYGPQVFPSPRKSNAWKDRYALATNPQPEPAAIRSLRLRLSERYGVPFNSVQCNWHDGNSQVKAHCDPYRVIAMARLGAKRTFEVGEQRRNGGNNFKPYPMPHGSLITFLSGGLAHRMFPDPAAGDCVSLVFRLVTPPQTVASWHDKPIYGKTRAAHKKLYDTAVSEYRAALTFRDGGVR
jgi:hypothetical protein